MSKDCDNCGHDHSEYDPNEDPLVMSFALGAPNIRPEALQAIIQTCVSEIFIRVPEGMFDEEWAFINRMVVEMFNPDTTPQPEALEVFTKARNKLAAARDQDNFMESVMNDLDALDTVEKKEDFLQDTIKTIKKKLIDGDNPDLGSVVVDINVKKNKDKDDNDGLGNYL